MPEREYEARRIGAVLLAAGGSTRMGFPKQLLGLGGETLLENTMKAALCGACDPVIVVLGAHVSRVAPLLAGKNVGTVFNKDWAQGMHTSIRLGIMALSERAPGIDAVILCAIDQPYITAKHVSNIGNTFRSSGSRIVASSYSGTIGTPALFGRGLFAELMELPDGGAKHILRKYEEEVATVCFPGGEVDIDTFSDYLTIKVMS